MSALLKLTIVSTCVRYCVVCVEEKELGRMCIYVNKEESEDEEKEKKRGKKRKKERDGDDHSHFSMHVILV